LASLKNKTNDQKEILKVHKLDIKSQKTKTDTQQKNSDRSEHAETDAKEERDQLDTGNGGPPLHSGGVRALKSSISYNQELFERRSTALKRHQLMAETQVIEALDLKLHELQQQTEKAKAVHENLKKRKIARETEMKQKQESLENQVKAQLDSIRGDCKATQNQFEQCLDMIEKRNEQV
jgi:hypothetical protein